MTGVRQQRSPGDIDPGSTPELKKPGRGNGSVIKGPGIQPYRRVELAQVKQRCIKAYLIEDDEQAGASQGAAASPAAFLHANDQMRETLGAVPLCDDTMIASVKGLMDNIATTKMMDRINERSDFDIVYPDDEHKEDDTVNTEEEPADLSTDQTRNETIELSSSSSGRSVQCLTPHGETEPLPSAQQIISQIEDLLNDGNAIDDYQPEGGELINSSPRRLKLLLRNI